MLSFNTIPVNLQLPGTFIEISTSAANNRLVPLQRDILLMGQKLDSGSATADTVTSVTSYNRAVQLFGAGSELAAMFKVAFDNYEFGTFYAIAFDDPQGAVAEIRELTVTQAANTTGSVVLYIGGVRIEAVVGATATATAANIRTAIGGADTSFTASGNGAVITLTCKHAGIIGGGLPIVFDYYGDETLPTGLELEIATDTNGAGQVNIDDADALLGDNWFQTVIMPSHIDSTAIVQESEERNGGTRQIPSQIFQCAQGDFDAVLAMADNSNSGLHAITAIGEDSPYPDSWFAAALGAYASFALENDPARPLQNVNLKSIGAPAQISQYTAAQRNRLLQAGIGTFRYNINDQVIVERLRTTYKADITGEYSDVLGDVEDVATLIFLRWSLVRFLNLLYPRFKIADDGDPTPPGANITKPSLIKSSIIGLAEQWRETGLITDVEAFKAEIVVERDSKEEDRVNINLTPKLIGQLRQIFGSLNFTL